MPSILPERSRSRIETRSPPATIAVLSQVDGARWLSLEGTSTFFRANIFDTRDQAMVALGERKVMFGSDSAPHPVSRKEAAGCAAYVTALDVTDLDSIRRALGR